ncbi:MAG: nuclear transport factor 2 family protein [Steroidobacteraceae bacterium]|nr:nuclear transport factor 2 family protein [Steroidobacteraceae bacterium]
MAVVPLIEAWRGASLAALVVLGALLSGCGQPDSPEAQVRAVVQEAKEAAEARDASRLFDLIAPDYRDPRGFDADELERYLRGWLIAHQRVRLLTRVESIEFPAEDLARLSVTVGMVGREAGAEAWNLAADVYDIDVTLARENGEWRVTRADWRRGAGN